MLVSKGANANIPDKTGWTTLHQAARNNSDPQIIEILINNGADLQIKDTNGDTPYDIAVKHNRNNAIQQALKKAFEVQENFFKFAQEGECKGIEESLRSGYQCQCC